MAVEVSEFWVGVLCCESEVFFFVHLVFHLLFGGYFLEVVVDPGFFSFVEVFLVFTGEVVFLVACVFDYGVFAAFEACDCGHWSVSPFFLSRIFSSFLSGMSSSCGCSPGRKYPMKIPCRVLMRASVTSVSFCFIPASSR